MPPPKNLSQLSRHLAFKTLLLTKLCSVPQLLHPPCVPCTHSCIHFFTMAYIKNPKPLHPLVFGFLITSQCSPLLKTAPQILTNPFGGQHPPPHEELRQLFCLLGRLWLRHDGREMRAFRHASLPCPQAERRKLRDVWGFWAWADVLGGMMIPSCARSESTFSRCFSAQRSAWTHTEKCQCLTPVAQRSGLFCPCARITSCLLLLLSRHRTLCHWSSIFKERNWLLHLNFFFF